MTVPFAACGGVLMLRAVVVMPSTLDWILDSFRPVSSEKLLA
jgi:hypothetical protein